MRQVSPVQQSRAVHLVHYTQIDYHYSSFLQAGHVRQMSLVLFGRLNCLMLETLAEIKLGQKVLDIATGIGEPAVTAARKLVELSGSY